MQPGVRHSLGIGNVLLLHIYKLDRLGGNIHSPIFVGQ